MPSILKGNLGIADTDYHVAKWTGRTKTGAAVIITLNDAINLGNLEWAFGGEDKEPVVQAAEFTACYNNGDTEEPWQVEFTEEEAGSNADNIVLDYGVFSIDGVDIALNKGGGSFKVEREYTPIVADGDKGTVKDRIVLTKSEAKLTMNALSILNTVDKLMPGLTKTTSA